MSVMRTKDGKELFVDCSCGCEMGLKLKLGKFEDQYVFLSFVSGNFYKEQGYSIFGVIGSKLKKIWRIIRGKDYVYSDICLSRGDLDELREYLDDMIKSYEEE